MISRRSLLIGISLSSIVEAKAWRFGRSILPISLVLVTPGASPVLTYNFRTMPIVDDVLTWYDGVTVLGTHTITQADIDDGAFTGGLAPLGSGSHSITVRQARSSGYSISNAIALTV
jgi:hypothetical protein